MAVPAVAAAARAPKAAGRAPAGAPVAGVEVDAGKAALADASRVAPPMGGSADARGAAAAARE